MKVIFLDNDGVICLFANWGSRLKKQKVLGGCDDIPSDMLPLNVRFDNFDKKAVQVLNNILETTGAEIVVSSDWRKLADLEELGEYYLEQGISKAPIGVTRHIDETDYPIPFKFDRYNQSEQERSLEILDYLKNHPEVTHWVAVDDLDMGSSKRDWGLDNFVWTPQDTEGIKQSGKKEAIIKFLSKK